MGLGDLADQRQTQAESATRPGAADADRAAGERVLHETWLLLTDYPGMLLAVAGTAALVAVVVTSIRAARRRLRYESWHPIHLYVYLGVGLALPHQLWTGADFTAAVGRRGTRFCSPGRAER